MKRFLILSALLLCTAGMKAQSISYIETTSAWHYIYDQNGKKIKTISTSQGTIAAYSASFYILKQGKAFYVVYDASGRRLTTLSVNNVGEILSANGDNFVSRNGAWIYTWNKYGKKINTRSAR